MEEYCEKCGKLMPQTSLSPCMGCGRLLCEECWGDGDTGCEECEALMEYMEGEEE